MSYKNILLKNSLKHKKKNNDDAKIGKRRHTVGKNPRLYLEYGKVSWINCQQAVMKK